MPLREVVPKMRARLDTLTLPEVGLVEPLRSPQPLEPAPNFPFSSVAAAAAVVVGLPTPRGRLAQTGPSSSTRSTR